MMTADSTFGRLDSANIMETLVDGAVGRKVVALGPADPVDDPHGPLAPLRLVVAQVEDQVLYDVCTALSCERCDTGEECKGETPNKKICFTDTGYEMR